MHTNDVEEGKKQTDIADKLRQTYQQANQLERFNGQRYPISQSYINLVIVKPQAIKTQEKFQSIQTSTNNQKGSLNDNRLQTYEALYTSQEEIPVDQMFAPQDGKPTKKIAIYGEAGVGKSTLCRSLVTKWQESKWGATQFKGVIWLRLRELLAYGQDNPTLEQVIIDTCMTGRNKPQFEQIKAYLDTDMDKLLFILDGYDEVAQVLHQHPWLQRMLQDILCTPEYHVILTSRPVVIRKIGSQEVKFDKELENVGFTDKNITEYVTTFYKNTADGLMKFLQHNNSIWRIAHIPINLDLICDIWKPGQQASHTISQLYIQVTHKLLLRYLEKEGVKIEEVSPKLLEEKTEKLIQALEQLALRGIKENQVIIPAQYAQEELIKVEKQLDEQNLLPLLLKTGIIKIGGDNRLAQDILFLHQTFQEYYAASWLARQFSALGGPEYEQATALLKKHKYNEYYEVVWRFTAGILYSQGKDKGEFLGLVKFLKEWDSHPRELIGVRHTCITMKLLDECQVDVKVGIINNLLNKVNMVVHHSFNGGDPSTIIPQYHQEILKAQSNTTYFNNKQNRDRNSDIASRNKIAITDKLNRMGQQYSQRYYLLSYWRTLVQKMDTTKASIALFQHLNLLTVYGYGLFSMDIAKALETPIFSKNAKSTDDLNKVDFLKNTNKEFEEFIRKFGGRERVVHHYLLCISSIYPIEQTLGYTGKSCAEQLRALIEVCDLIPDIVRYGLNYRPLFGAENEFAIRAAAVQVLAFAGQGNANLIREIFNSVDEQDEVFLNVATATLWNMVLGAYETGASAHIVPIICEELTSRSEERQKIAGILCKALLNKAYEDVIIYIHSGEATSIGQNSSLDKPTFKHVFAILGAAIIKAVTLAFQEKPEAIKLLFNMEHNKLYLSLPDGNIRLSRCFLLNIEALLYCYQLTSAAEWLYPLQDPYYLYSQSIHMLRVENAELVLPESKARLSKEQTQVVLKHIQDAALKAKLPTDTLDYYRGVGALGIQASQDSELEYTPLHKAAEAGRLSAVQEIIERGEIDINNQNNLGRHTALILATKEAHWDIVQYLLQHGADGTCIDKYIDRAIGLSWFVHNNQQYTELMLQKFFLSSTRYKAMLDEAALSYTGLDLDKTVENLVYQVTGHSAIQGWRQKPNIVREYRMYLENITRVEQEHHNDVLTPKGSPAADILAVRLYIYIDLYLRLLSGKEQHLPICTESNYYKVQALLAALYNETLLIINTLISSTASEYCRTAEMFGPSTMEWMIHAHTKGIVDYLSQLMIGQEYVIQSGYAGTTERPEMGHCIYVALHKLSATQVLARVDNRWLQNDRIDYAIHHTPPWYNSTSAGIGQIKSYAVAVFSLDADKKALKEYIAEILKSFTPIAPTPEAILAHIYGLQLTPEIKRRVSQTTLEQYGSTWPYHKVQTYANNCTLSSHNLGVSIRHGMTLFKWFEDYELKSVPRMFVEAIAPPHYIRAMKPQNVLSGGSPLASNSSNSSKGSETECYSFEASLYEGLIEHLQKILKVANIVGSTVVQEALVGLAGICTSQENSVFFPDQEKIGPTVFYLKFADQNELDKFIHYYTQRFPRLIISKPSSVEGGMTQVVLDTITLYHQVAKELGAYTHPCQAIHSPSSSHVAALGQQTNSDDKCCMM